MMKYFIFLLSILCSVVTCTEEKIEIVTNSLWAKGSTVLFQSAANSKIVPFNTDIESANLTVQVSSNGASWCDAVFESQEKSLKVSVKDNNLSADRIAVVTVTGKNLKQDIKVKQKGNVTPKDKLVKVARVTATSFAESNKPENMIDGDFSSFFNSQFGAITEWPFYLDFYFEDVENINYFIYTPRPSGTNAWGSLGKVEIYAATEKNPTLTLMGKADFLETNDISRKFIFNKPLEKPTQIQIRVFSGFNDRVSCAEMQFFEIEEGFDFDYTTIFTDGSCSELKPHITRANVDTIPVLFYKQIALDIISGKSNPYRIASFRPYKHPDHLARSNKSRSYSLRDNATGIYIKQPGEELVVLVGNTRGQQLKTNIYDFKNKKEVTFSLNEGINIITPNLTGLVYVYNHTDKDIPLIATDEKSKAAIDALTVKMQFIGGEVNGYFDVARHTSDDWSSILANATFTEMDILGTHSHLVWTVNDFKKYNTDIVKMTGYIDGIVKQQQEFVGLYHHNRMITNRMFLHIEYAAAAAYATNYRTAYNSNYAEVVCSEDGFLRRMWVLGHELGHVNQVNPGVKWHGTTEVTNNLYAMYNQFSTLGEARRLFDNSDVDGYGFAFKNIIEDKQPFLLPEKFNNHIPKVSPFWQLYLYFVQIKGKQHFYHDLYEHFRTTNSPSEPGLQQLDFVRQVCNVAQTDMTDFFIAWGFLRPIDSNINDYGNKQVTITQKQIDDLIEEIKAKKYPQPEILVQEITDRNYKNYIN